MIELTLPYPVSANRYWRTVVNRKTGHAMTFVSEEAKSYKRQVGWLAKEAGISAPLLGRIELAYTLHPKLPQDWTSRARKDPSGWMDSVQCMDLDNAQKVLLDSLKNVVFADDKWIRKIIAERGEPLSEACVKVRVALIDQGLLAA